MMRTPALLIVTALASAGCASLPDVKLRYWLPTWTAQVKVTLTVTCTAGDSPVVVALPRAELQTTLGADPKRPVTIELNRLDSAWANTTFSMTLSDDGRLLAINSDGTGQGETIVKAGLGLLTTLAGLKSAGVANEDNTANACAAIAALAGAGKTYPLVFTAPIPRDSQADNGPLAFAPDTATAPLLQKFGNSLPRPEGTWSLGAPLADRTVAVHSYTDAAAVLVKLPVPQRLSATVTFGMTEPVVAPRLVSPAKPPSAPSVSLLAEVPSRSNFTLPILPPRAFGKQSFALELYDSGNVKKLTYAKDAGTAAALNAASEAAGKLGPAGETARLKAEADLLAAEQRLLVCRTSPKDCK
jgi:hypothetical protein